MEAWQLVHYVSYILPTLILTPALMEENRKRVGACMCVDLVYNHNGLLPLSKVSSGVRR